MEAETLTELVRAIGDLREGLLGLGLFIGMGLALGGLFRG